MNLYRITLSSDWSNQLQELLNDLVILAESDEDARNKVVDFFGQNPCSNIDIYANIGDAGEYWDVVQIPEIPRDRPILIIE